MHKIVIKKGEKSDFVMQTDNWPSWLDVWNLLVSDFKVPTSSAKGYQEDSINQVYSFLQNFSI